MSRILVREPLDKYVVWLVLALSAVGVVTVYSAIAYLADTKAGGDTSGLLLGHVMKLGLALTVMLAVSYIDYRLIAQFAKAFLIGSLVLLVVVKLAGVASGGATRWLRIGAFGFQPSDLARFSLILYAASLLARKQTYMESFSRAFAPLLFWMLVTGILIGMEDLSTALVALAVVGLMGFVARVRIWQLAAVAGIVLTLGYALLLTSPHRAARVESFVGVKIFPHTSAEEVFSERDEGYQSRQARIAMAMGGLTGKGPGKSTQRNFLPEAYNDFIFAIIAEEYGALGALAILAMLMAFLFRGFLRIARYAPDPLGLFLAVGLTAAIAIYGFAHAGVVSGVLPVTGLPLPFVSYGGTSMLISGVMVGMLLNISRQLR
ncbi:MAG: cell division protein FtsW [Rhodothermales bacterium]|nr:cell division protein FtsW [Rhodothermales bacterium]